MDKELCNSTSHLPLEVLARLLQSVQQRDRLGNCALVGKGWRQAAKMATTDLYCGAGRKGYDSLLAWLNNNEYASKVLSMSLVGHRCHATRPILQLPAARLSQLNTLKLESNCLQVIDASPPTTPTSTAPTAAAASLTTIDVAAPSVAVPSVSAPSARTIAALTALTRLQLDTCRLDLSELSSCTGLQSLFAWDVSHVAGQGSATCSAKGYVRAQRGSESSAEEALSLSEEAASGATAEQASSEDSSTRLSREEEQWVEREEAAEDGEDGASAVSYLPPELTAALPHLTQLTSLVLISDMRYIRRSRFEWQATKPPCSASLISLQQLQYLKLSVVDKRGLDLAHLPMSLTRLDLCHPPPLTIRTMPGLQHLLRLQYLAISGPGVLDFDAKLLSKLTQLKHLCFTRCSMNTVTALRQLMSVLEQLIQLESLNLDYSLTKEADTPEVYSAVTSNGLLYLLDLSNCKLTSGATRYMFSSRRPCQLLSTLRADAALFQDAGSFATLASACPALKQLEVCGPLFSGIPGCIDWQGLSTLSNLAELRRLQLWRVQLPIDAMSGIAACTRLKDLDLDIIDDWTPVDKAFSAMMQLTQMTGLMCLRICATVNGKNFGLNLGAKSGGRGGSPPVVYQQLQEVLFDEISDSY